MQNHDQLITKLMRRPGTRPSYEGFKTLDYLRREADLGKREDFERLLKLVPDVPARAGDELS